MMNKHPGIHALLITIFLVLSSCQQDIDQTSEASQYQIPHLQKIGRTTQLIVEDKPFIILGGELGNSSFTSLEYMEPIWRKLKAMNLNTVLAPVYWELIEPAQGEFDFKLLDDLIEEARKNDLKLILLWFGSWKNSMSSHAPSWIKTNQNTYPRTKDSNGISQEIITPFSDNNLRADLTAFVTLMKHLKEIDNIEQTVIMIQPENEIGMLPSARDHCSLANEKFMQHVPAEFMNYLGNNKEILVPEFYKIWKEHGLRTEGSWQEVFGEGSQTDEIFMAWYFANFVENIIRAGKEIYPLPMFVNAALNRPDAKPGEYPSAGPLPHLMDVWKAGAPSVDFLCPDFYNPDFQHWNDLYVRQQNPLFIPEHRFDNTVAGKAAFAIGHYEALGFAPFSIESTNDPENEPLGKMYGLIDQLSPIISSNVGKGRVEGVLLNKEKEAKIVLLGDYQLTFNHSYKLGWEAAAKNENWDMAGAIIIQTGDNEFYVAGNGIYITFKNVSHKSKRVGILKAEEGKFIDNEWQVIRHLNGDQTHQGRHIRIFKEDYMIQRFELYSHD